MLLVEIGAVCSLCNFSIKSCIVMIMLVVARSWFARVDGYGFVAWRARQRFQILRGADGHGGEEPTVLAAIARRREVPIEESSADSRADPAGAGLPVVQWRFEIELRGWTWWRMNLDRDRGCADRPLL